MGTSYGAAQMASMFASCVLYAPLINCAAVSSGGYDVFPVIPSGVTATNNGTFTKTDLGNNQSVLNFDGSTNGISLTDNAAWYFATGNFAIAMWIKVSSSMSTNARLFMQGAASTYNPISITVTVGGYIGIAGSYAGTAWNIVPQVLSTATISDDVWNHVLVQRSGTALNIYLNGIFDSTINVSTNPFFDSSNPLVIGRDGSSNYFMGNLAHLMVWKGRALTQPEIKLLMNRTHPVTGAGLLPSGDYFRLS